MGCGERVYNYPVVNGETYNFNRYRCEFNVLYHYYEAQVPMIDITGAPVQCTTVSLSTDEFDKLDNKHTTYVYK